MIHAEEAKHLTMLARARMDPWVKLSEKVRIAADKGLERIEFSEISEKVWFEEPVTDVLSKLEELGFNAKNDGFHSLVVEW